jgi:hypothetical protein
MEGSRTQGGVPTAHAGGTHTIQHNFIRQCKSVKDIRQRQLTMEVKSHRADQGRSNCLPPPARQRVEA